MIGCLLSLLLGAVPAFAASLLYVPAVVQGPEPMREFRGAWLATVANIDWPSKPGLPVVQQRAELTALLDRAVQLKLNAIIFQVRPSGDAFYVSSSEPWSEYLTGHMGRAPEPGYDPLALAISEAHRRGLELHAWFNPFRAQHALAKSAPSAGHVSRTHPDWVHKYGDELDLDPGEPAVREYVRQVVLDVVNRYDIDGVHFDDYFYPYPIKDSLKRDVDFPDLATWQKYGVPERLDRANWRRQNINTFVRGMDTAIKSAKPWVQFGISPFGIWRPMNPASVRGFDAYAKIYADSRLWLANGWVDYLSPQLYWPVSSLQQSFPALLQWWEGQDIQHRHIWPGLGDYRTGQLFAANEIPQQVLITRAFNAPGAIHFHLRSVVDNHLLFDALRAEYAEPALPPISPWLGTQMPTKPILEVTPDGIGVRINWGNGLPTGGEASPTRNWVVQLLFKAGWQTQIFPASRTSWGIAGRPPETVVVRAADRLGNLSEPASVVRTKPTIPPIAGHRAG